MIALDTTQRNNSISTSRKREHHQHNTEAAVNDQQRQLQHQRPTAFLCVVCANESNGVHFGQLSCRACAAFFRRTISQNQTYTCKKDGNCEIANVARNICRSCRFNKCLRMGMLVSAVQNQNQNNNNNNNTNVSVVQVQPTNGTQTFVPNSNQLAEYHQQTTQQHDGGLLYGVPNVNSSSNSQRGIRINRMHSTTTQFDQLSSPSGSSAKLSTCSSNPPSSTSLAPPESAATTCSSTAGGSSTLTAQLSSMELKHLSRYLDGYKHLLTLKMSALAMLDESFPLRKVVGISNVLLEEIPQSNYDNCKKMCLLSITLAFETLERFFTPFIEVPLEDKRKLFKSFFQPFCNTNRAFRSSKRFPAGDDRLLMPDEGCVRLSELHLFFENCTMVIGNPVQLALLFQHSIHYLVHNVVPYMRSIEMDELELMAIAGMFLWNDSSDVSPETQLLAKQTRNEIIVDLHNHYRTLGLSEQEITLRTANLFLLIPKLETAVKMMVEDTSISDVFNMLNIDEPCKSYSIV